MPACPMDSDVTGVHSAHAGPARAFCFSLCSLHIMAAASTGGFCQFHLFVWEGEILNSTDL